MVQAAIAALAAGDPHRRLPPPKPTVVVPLDRCALGSG
jgi:hypothetical protein